MRKRKTGPARKNPYVGDRRVKGVAERRFLANAGQRWYRGHEPTVRCHAISRRKKFYALQKYGLDVDLEAIFPEIQCGRAARPGSYVCYRHGAGKKGGPSGGRPPKNMSGKGLAHYMRYELGEKWAKFASDPDIFAQREQVALLKARQAELLEDLKNGGTISRSAASIIRKGLSMVERGDVRNGCELIREGLDRHDNEKEAWRELKEMSETILKLSNAEINRVKEMRLAMSQDQVFGLIDRLFELMVNTVEVQISNPEERVKVLKVLDGGIRDIIGTNPQQVLLQAGNEDREGDGDALNVD